MSDLKAKIAFALTELRASLQADVEKAQWSDPSGNRGDVARAQLKLAGADMAIRAAADAVSP